MSFGGNNPVLRRPNEHLTSILKIIKLDASYLNKWLHNPLSTVIAQSEPIIGMFKGKELR